MRVGIGDEPIRVYCLEHGEGVVAAADDKFRQRIGER